MDRLTEEQQFILRRIEIEAQDLEKEELIDALLDCWEVRFRLKQTFMEFTREAGLSFRLEEAQSPSAPECLEDLEEIFGYEPSEQETMEFMKSVYENATMELDMDEIILGGDQQCA